MAEVDRVLRQLARHPTLTHEVLDQLPPGRTTDYMRNLILDDRLTDVTGTSVIRQWRAVFVTVTYWPRISLWGTRHSA